MKHMDETAEQALSQGEAIIRDCQRILADWVPSGSSYTEKQTLERLLSILDGPRGRSFDAAVARARGEQQLPFNPLEQMHATQETRQ
ncbi:MAG TPA: hypothetical protein VEF76_10485 [Patescibacteria group bacterium]|nr:hypothetical protein [Patescibacteria group bacterium]